MPALLVIIGTEDHSAPEDDALSKVNPRRERKKMGRPTKYSIDIARRIFKRVSEGCSREAAAALAGITAATLYEWKNNIPEFSEGLEKADAKFEQKAIANISKAGQSRKHWTANAWLLERKLPQRYGKVERHEIQQSSAMQVAPSEEYIAAVNKALGIYPGGFRPRVNGVEVSEEEYRKIIAQRATQPEQAPRKPGWPPPLLPQKVESGDSKEEEAEEDDPLPTLP